MHESYLIYRDYKYLRIALVLVGIAVLLYVAQPADHLPRGNTWLGYTLGTLSAGIIFSLLYLSIRKRRYLSGQGSLTAWVSSHVYLGLTLVVLASLHSGFRFGWNVHTLTYVLMVLVIATGIYGVYAYRRYPNEITKNRLGMKRDSMLEVLGALDRECLVLADKVSAFAHATVLRVVEETVFGGSLWHQITGRSSYTSYRSPLWKSWIDRRNAVTAADAVDAVTRRREILELINEMVAAKSHGKADDLLQLVDLMSQRLALADRIRYDVQYHALLEFWLYLHVPLAVALLAALLIHIFVVFLYW